MLNSVRNLLNPPQGSSQGSSDPPAGRSGMSNDSKSLNTVLQEANKLLSQSETKHKGRGSVISHWHISHPAERSPASFRTHAGKVLMTFHNGDVVRNQMAIAKFVMADTNCDSVVIIRLLANDLFRIYFRGTQPLLNPETYDLAQFVCLRNIIETKREVIQSDEDVKALNMLVQWRPILQTIPDVVVAIPMLQVNQSVCGVVALTFKRKLPSDFMPKFPELKMFLSNVVPYTMLLQAAHDFEEDCHRHSTILESLDVIERDRGDPNKCAIAIGTELSKLSDCRNFTVLKIDYTECILTRVYTVGKQKSAGVFGCIDSQCHEESHFKFDSKTPIGWVALNRKPIKWNENTECKDLGMTKKQFHSVLFCTSLKNLLIVPIHDHSTEKSLIVELVDKEGGFTLRDMEVCCSFSRAVTFIYTCAVMGAHRGKSNRRNSMVNQILLNIDPVKHVKVEQFITSQRRASQDLYTGKFLTYTFSIKTLSENDMNGAIIHIFYDMDFITKFKIRKTTLIRFILTAQQGYRPLAYHNWQHACSVTHFVYILVKNLKLVTEGYLTVLEAFSVIVSALVHDIDHRGTNNRFQSCTNSELFQLYNTQESIMERHHLFIALSILRREECNILENLSQEDYKEFLELMTWNILATDIAKYVNTREDNFKRLKDFHKDKKGDRLALLSLMMTAADVNDCVKPWDDNLISVRHILTEFFGQGDLEKELGMSPMPMMDRTLAYIPEVEFKFLSGVVCPVFRELALKFPTMQICMDTLNRSLEYWELSTVIFDANKNVSDQLSILSYKELTEDSLKHLEKTVNQDLIRRFTEKHEEKLKSGAVQAAMSKILPKKLRNRLKSRKSLVEVDHPEEEFRQMFSDKDAETEASASDDDESNSVKSKRCGCCRRKKKKPKPRTSISEEEIHSRPPSIRASVVASY